MFIVDDKIHRTKRRELSTVIITVREVVCLVAVYTIWTVL